MNGNIGYQGPGACAAGKVVLSARAPLLQYGGVLIFIVPSLRARRRAGRMADAPLRRPAHLPCGGNAVQAGGDLRSQVRQRDQASESAKVLAVCCCRSDRVTPSEELPPEWPFLPYRPASPAEPEHFIA